ncbi:protein translocase subunit SecD [Candidatus Woesebacteria bacterium CG_4_10_14_0_2_um_filter_39_14]|uniref:Protein translocase subunit SecD n=3 Tax=Microgenomates group TaxID=1794810 RepID=A0A2M6YPF2_9BACT|nr:MAG: protein translocase subunit SecD [Candidatus Shapirobacteria bacterium CG07_land_8_20_14_0_80_39_12]PIZ48363.1 MAG: protein translocase subunit SecD [Candidatus Woesebacteria bacterium CG_4_10_14_0_2_um_filter_39_14]PJA49484.1 MAG: protein translocase subunit SecD [Candidatus Shapirobacteria bacterium CG_4_9_14_3_um_filter_39_13]
MKNYRFLIWLIIILTLGSLYVNFPNGIHLKFAPLKIDKEIFLPFFRELEIKKGIDLAGGTHLVFQADMSAITSENRQAAIDAAKDNIEKRVNLFGVAEPVIQTSKVGDDYRLIVELAGITDINQAIDLIGQTAQLDFRELPQEATQAATYFDFKTTGLTGKDLRKSEVKFDPNSGEPQVGLEFNNEGAQKFADITSRNVNKRVAIFLDELPLTAPNVQEPITSGDAVISGDFTLDEAKKMSIQLNAGALPVPIELIEQRNIGATLGAESVQKSIQAGLIGLLMVIIFMAAYYGRLGLLADVALIIYGLLTLALYKLIPVTLTLPGIAGFILSIGMAVDANILIFERMKEELRAGKSRIAAMELGFGRAWDSIRDANVCILITCFILFNPFSWPFLNTSGMVRGFALTLGLGVILSLFTSIVVTRTLIRAFYRKEEMKHD